MKIKDILELDINILFPLLQEHGVRALSIGDVSITLSEKQAQNQIVNESRFEDEDTKTNLSCGHKSWEANELGECLHGCIQINEEE